MIIGAGERREQVTIQYKPTTGSTFSSSGAGAWTNIASNPTEWVKVRGLRGTEMLQAGTLLGKQFFQVIMNYRTDITVRNRLVWGSRNLEIRNVNPDPKKMWLDILCEEVA